MDALESDELRRAVLFYRETGCRKREPFISRRVGNTLIIPPMKKNPKERRVQLSDVMCKVHDEMVDRFNKRMLKCKSKKAGWDWYYIKLKQACKVVGIDHKTLHDLRDTFIIRLWAITGDIHMVSTKVGHTDIKQTVEKNLGQKDFFISAKKCFENIFQNVGFQNFHRKNQKK